MKKSKKKFEITLKSHGLYAGWDNARKELPRIIEFTNKIPASEGTEFGMILNIKKGKGITLDYCITHPPITDEKGIPMPDFTGEHIILSNDYDFYIGDSIRTPAEQYSGKWIIDIIHKDKLLIRKEFEILTK